MKSQVLLSLKLLVLFTMTANAITFEKFQLQDNSETNYSAFNDPQNSLANSFEKIVADFNGDGFDDILSLGGDLSLIEDLILPGGAVVPSAPLSLMLYQNGEYINHQIGMNVYSPLVNIIDIDGDNDLDIIMMNGKIAINDGQANFTEIQFNANRAITEKFYTTDIDGNNSLDIVTKNYIFKNNGHLQFTQESNDLANESEHFHVADINHDGYADMLVLKNDELQSWINDGIGNFELLSSIQVPVNIFIIHALGLTTNNRQDFILSFHAQTQDQLILLKNDGEGVFSSHDFLLDTGNFEFDTLKIGKIFNRDANNDGTQDMWIASIFKNNASCENSQNLLVMYSPIDDGNWQYQLTLHSEGLIKENLITNRFTVDSLPTLVDINNDHLPDVVFTGDKPQTWLSRESTYNQAGVVYHLSNASLLQYSQHIDSVDYDNDGNNDIFSASQYSGNCPVLDYQEGFYTAAHQLRSTLWLNDGDGKFAPFSSPFGGGNDFLRPYEYMVFADLENDGVQNIIATITAYEGQPRASYYIYPRIVDPGLSFKLPEVTLNAKVINIDATGDKKEIIMIADNQEAPILVLGLNNGKLLEQARLDFGARDGEFKLADMDGDGTIDIVASDNKGLENSVTIWYNNGNREFTKNQDITDHAYGIAVLDFNNDGLLDLFISSRDIWLNQGNREFSKLRYDSNFWSTPFGLPFYQYLVPKKMEVVDVNHDGKDDIIFSNLNDYYVYINDSSANQISFYLTYATSFTTQDNQFNIILRDIDNDKKLDFIVGTENNIAIYTQHQETPITGLYFDPEHNGHGHAIQAIGHKNLYFSIFFSYDDQGNPEWYSTLNRYVEFNTDYYSKYYFVRLDQNEFIHYLYDYSSRSAQIDENIQNNGYLVFSGSTQNSFLDTFSYKIGDEFETWNIQAIVSQSHKPENNLSGLWWAGSDDAGWGVSLSFVQRENTQEVVVVLYVYDELGEPRWLIGQSTGFELNKDILVDMKQINGYGRLQNHVELTEIDSGTITLNLKQASTNLNEAGSMSMNIHYPDDGLNDNWVRDDIPFALFSKPRN